MVVHWKGHPHDLATASCAQCGLAPQKVGRLNPVLEGHILQGYEDSEETVDLLDVAREGVGGGPGASVHDTVFRPHLPQWSISIFSSSIKKLSSKNERG